METRSPFPICDHAARFEIMADEVEWITPITFKSVHAPNAGVARSMRRPGQGLEPVRVALRVSTASSIPPIVREPRLAPTMTAVFATP